LPTVKAHEFHAIFKTLRLGIIKSSTNDEIAEDLGKILLNAFLSRGIDLKYDGKFAEMKLTDDVDPKVIVASLNGYLAK